MIRLETEAKLKNKTVTAKMLLVSLPDPQDSTGGLTDGLGMRLNMLSKGMDCVQYSKRWIHTSHGLNNTGN